VKATHKLLKEMAANENPAGYDVDVRTVEEVRQLLAKERPVCELASEFCSGEGVTLMTGTRKGDPKFYGCLACVAIYRRRGVKMKQAKEWP
jgi:hypothetical protein